MKKLKILPCVCMLCLLFTQLIVTSFAEDYKGSDDWSVLFDGEKMNSNFSTEDMNDPIREYVQPGDNIEFTISIENQYEGYTDWWMSNEVLKSFEDKSVANGGAYTYVLTYYDTDKKKQVIYSSNEVGGEEKNGDEEGLREATGALKNMFFLDTLESGEKGKLVLQVGLDGETQNNSYQDTLANLKMNFAVELADWRDPNRNPNGLPGDNPSGNKQSDGSNNSSRSKSNIFGLRNIVKTGDSNHIAIYIASLACGLLSLIAGIVLRSKSKPERGED